MQEIAANRFWVTALYDFGEPRRLTGARISTNFFRVLGVTMPLGRDFSPDDARPGAEPVVILSYRLWQGPFLRDEKVLGQTVRLGDGLYSRRGAPRIHLAEAPFLRGA